MEYEINTQKSIVFVCMNNKKELVRSVPLMVAIKIKCFGINLTKEVKELYIETLQNIKERNRRH